MLAQSSFDCFPGTGAQCNGHNSREVCRRGRKIFARSGLAVAKRECPFIRTSDWKEIYESIRHRNRQRYRHKTSLETSILSRVDARGTEQRGTRRLCAPVLSARCGVSDVSLG